MRADARLLAGPEVLRDVGRLAERLRRAPVPDTARAGARRFRLRLDEAGLAGVVFGSGNLLFLSRLPAAVDSALAGDMAPLRRLVATPALGGASPERAHGRDRVPAAACRHFPRAFSYADLPAARGAAYERALQR